MKKGVLSILQVIGYLALITAFTVILMGLTKTFIGDWESGGPRVSLLGDGILTTLGIAIAGLVILRALRSSMVFRGWPGFGTAVRWFGRGALIGLAMAGSMLLLTLALGGGRISLQPAGLQAYLIYVVPFGGCLLISALSEEWLFRGYPLTKLASVLGAGWASLAMSLVFAAAHLGSAGSNPLVHVNIVLGSLVVGALRFTPGGIAAAWGFHFAWNYTQVLCGASLSLEGVNVPGVDFEASGSAALSGGTFGPEGGIAATLVTLIFLLLGFVYFRRSGVLDLPLPLGRSGPPESILEKYP